MIDMYNGWPESWALIPEWTEISERVYNYFLNVLPPMFFDGYYFQCSEAYAHEQDAAGRFRPKYMTFVELDNRYYFLGIQFPGYRPRWEEMVNGNRSTEESRQEV